MNHLVTEVYPKVTEGLSEASAQGDRDALPKDRVCLLSRVAFTNLSTGARMSFQIVSPHEMDDIFRKKNTFGILIWPIGQLIRDLYRLSETPPKTVMPGSGKPSIVW